MELAQQKTLAGSAGSRRVIKDRLGHIVEDIGRVRAPHDGKDLALSIDSKIQYIAFTQLKDAVEKYQRQGGRPSSCSTCRPAKCWRWPTGRRTTRTTAPS